ncbi:MAG: energy transducer TonB [Terracidiphilus sp.]
MRKIAKASIFIPFLLASAIALSQTATDTTNSTPSSSISTGITPPVVIRTAPILVPPNFPGRIPDGAKFAVKVSLDENGKPQEIEVIKSASPLINDSVIHAVEKFQWNPATLDEQAIPISVDLDLRVRD